MHSMIPAWIMPSVHFRITSVETALKTFLKGEKSSYLSFRNLLKIR